MTDVFVSYKAEDRARVKPLVDALTAAGLSVWWDVQIEGGSAWRETIRERLDAAACVIVVWSETSTGPAGHFVQDEAARAKRRGVYLPIVIDDVDPPLGFGQEQALSLVGWRGARRDPRLTDVLDSVGAAMQGGPRPTPRAHARTLSRRRLSAGVIGAGLTVVLVIAAALFVIGAPGRLCAVTGLDCPSRFSTAPANSIAVLPLADIGGDSSQAWFADGLSEELITRLARINQLQVVGRTSAFKFKNSTETSAVIGRKLGVAFLLDGSVRRAGKHARVSASLIDAATGFERWNQTYDRDITDIFNVQSGIAQSVAEALRVKLLSGDLAVLSLGGTNSPAAFDAYLRGRQLFDRGGEEATYRAALADFDAAVSADPAYATAHAARGRVLLTIGDTFDPPAKVRDTFDAALSAARRAVELAPDLPLAQAALGEALLRRDLDFRAARPAFARSMVKGGGDAQILVMFAKFSSTAGDSAAALSAAGRAVVLDPLNPRAFGELGKTLHDARRYAEAIEGHRRELELNPKRASAHFWIGEALYLQGRYAEARREYALEPVSYLRLTGEAIVLKKLGDEAGAKSALASLLAEGVDASFYQQAEIYAQWNDPVRAFQALDAAFRTGDSGLIELGVDAELDPLRRDARFHELLDRIGLSHDG